MRRSEWVQQYHECNAYKRTQRLQQTNKTFAYTKTRNSWNVFAGKDISHKGGHCNCLLIIRSGESIPPAAASIEQNSQSQSVNGGHFSLLSRQILITKQK